MRPLHRAAQNSHKDVVQLLLDKRPYPNDEDEDAWTPLQWAAMNGHIDVVNLRTEGGGERRSHRERIRM